MTLFASVASLFISRWDVAVADKVPPELINKLGIAIGQRTYKAYYDLIASARYHRACSVPNTPRRGVGNPAAPHAAGWSSPRADPSSPHRWCRSGPSVRPPPP